jgi:hypothetical protein
MSVPIGSFMQQRRFPLYVADGTVTTGGTPQLVLPQHPSRSYLMLQNLSSASLWFEFGSARATCTISGGAVASFTITNSGFNFTKPPVVQLLGGGKAGNGTFLGLNQPGGAAPDSTLGVGSPAYAIATLSGSSVNAINLVAGPNGGPTGGTGYAIAPYVFIYNSDLDPYGCATPSATNGLLLTTGSAAFVFNSLNCPTDAVAVYGGTTGQGFVCRWMQ